jgi:outer membrane protein assembly factor BamB
MGDVMKTSWIPTTIPACLAVLGVLVLLLWTTTGTVGHLEARLPGKDGTPAPVAGQAASPVVAGIPVRGDGQAAEISGRWPGFRGAKRDGICDDGTRLARSWPPNGPPVRWQIDVGEGYAGAAIAHGCAYLIDYDEAAQADTLRCLSMTDGREVWRNSYPAFVTRNHGMSRTIPALAGDAVVSIGPRCHLACWDAATGQCRWLIDMVRQFQTEERQWYTGQCPLLDGDRVILAPCGPAAFLVAVSLKTGEVVWKTPNPRGWKMTHSSIMPMEFAGRRQYVYCGTGGAAGIAAEDGRELWHEETWKENFATSPSPLVLPGGRVFLCRGYDTTGALMLQLAEAGDGLSAKSLFTLDSKAFNSEQQTPILYQDHLYAVRKHRGQLVCLDLNGKEKWNSGPQKFGHGPYLIADGLVLVLSENGLLVAAEATQDGYRPLAKHPVLKGGHEAWGPMALVAGQLVVRDLTRMLCLDLRMSEK